MYLGRFRGITITEVSLDGLDICNDAIWLLRLFQYEEYARTIASSIRIAQL